MRISSAACCRRLHSRPGATPTRHRPGLTTGAAWRSPPFPPHRPPQLPMAWAAPTTAARVASRSYPKSRNTAPNHSPPATTWRCSMTTTTCRCRFLASSTRPCSARSGWLPRPQRRNRLMSQYRLNLFIQPEHAKRLEELAAKKGVSKSSIVAAALASWLSPDAGDQREAAIAKRLDRLSRQADRLERDQNIQIETLALFVRYFLTVSTPIPGSPSGCGPRPGQGAFRAVRRTAWPAPAAWPQLGARRGGGTAPRPGADG